MGNMQWDNHTSITSFILLGFQNLHEFQILLFLLFLAIYTVTIIGNVLIVILVVIDQRLHTPMYFFLANLSFLEAFYSSVITPKMLADCVAENRTISFSECITQLFLYVSLGITECFLLAIMAFDRYLAICKPLFYNNIMNFKLCLQLATFSWLSGFCFTSVSVGSVFNLYFCGPNEINQFVCDMEELIKLSCKKSRLTEMTVFLTSMIVTLSPFLFIIISYVYIISAVFSISSSTGRQKAFSTCVSHITVVSLYYGTIIILYGIPKRGQPPEFHKGLSVIYTVVTPMFNPIVYSLRNKDVKESFKKLVALNLGRV